MVKIASKNSSPSDTGLATSMAQLMARQPASFRVFKKGEEVEGKVKKITSKEILLDIGAKSDALVLEVEKANMDNLLAALKVGDSVRAVILSPESEEGFPVVSLRRALDTMMYAGLDAALKDNSTIEVQVIEPTRGGFYVEAENGIRGFLPNSQVVDEAGLIGQKIKVKIIESDRAKKRAIFSQKATVYITEIDALQKLAPAGAKVKAVVTQATSYGLYVVFPGDHEKQIEGFIHISEVSYDRVENLSSLYKKGDSIEAIVIDLDTENRRVNLSLKKLAKDAFSALSEKYKKEQKIKGKVIRSATRGVTIELEKGVSGFIPSDKIPAGTTFKEGDQISAEVSDIDLKRRVIILSPIVTKTFVGYR